MWEERRHKLGKLPPGSVRARGLLDDLKKTPKPKEPKKEKEPKPPVIANGRCLVLKLADQRCFFTHENNSHILIEFSRKYSAELIIANVKELPLLEMDDLVKLLSDEKAGKDIPPYEVVEVMLSPNAQPEKKEDKKPVKTTNEINKEIVEYVKSQLVEKRFISTDELVAKFGETNSRNSLSALMIRAKRDLQFQGYNIVREKPGQYVLTSAPSTTKWKPKPESGNEY